MLLLLSHQIQICTDVLTKRENSRVYFKCRSMRCHDRDGRNANTYIMWHVSLSGCVSVYVSMCECVSVYVSVC